MRTKVTLVLIFLNVVLFYYIFYHELPNIEERKLLETRRRVLPPEIAGLDSFTRTGRASPTVRIEKRGEAWVLTQPSEWPANLNAVSRIINELQLLEHETSFAVADLAKTGQTLADYGLADPALTFAFTSAGQTYTLRIGDDTKIGNRLYILSPDGSRIHVVGRSLADTLNLTLDQLRSPSIFTVPVFEVRSLGLQTGGTAGTEQNRGGAGVKTRLRREGARWAFETPIVVRADKAQVDTVINALNNLQTKRFLEEREADPEKTGLAAPFLRITLEGNSRRETLLLGRPVAPAPAGAAETEYYAKLEDRPAVFTTVVRAEDLDPLLSAQKKLRDTHILDFDPLAVTALNLAAPGQPEMNLQRIEGTRGESWQLVIRGAGAQPPQTIPADPALVADLLHKLQLLAARSFLSDAPAAADVETYGFNRPEREITLSLNTGGGPRGTDATTLALQVGVSSGQRDAAYARVGNAPYVYQIDPEILDLTPPLARHYRQRLLRELPEGARITGLKLFALPANTLVFDANNAAALTPETLAGLSVPESFRTALASLVTELRVLRAKDFTADSFNPEHGDANGQSHPWKYRLELTLALTAGNGGATANTSTLFFTDRLGGTSQLGGTGDFGGVTFALTQEMIDTLFALTYAPQHDPGAPAPKTAAAVPPAPAQAPTPTPTPAAVETAAPATPRT